MITERFEVVQTCALALLSGKVLHADGVTAGNGIVIDWRQVRSGEEVQRDADAYDTAELFVALVGPDQASSSTLEERHPDAPSEVPTIAPPPDAALEPSVIAWMRTPSGRNRTFEVGGFTITVHTSEDDDDSHATFTRELARLAASLP